MKQRSEDPGCPSGSPAPARVGSFGPASRPAFPTGKRPKELSPLRHDTDLGGWLLGLGLRAGLAFQGWLVVEQAVEDDGGQDLIAETRRPAWGVKLMGGDEGAAAFSLRRAGKQMRPCCSSGEVTESIHDGQLGPGEEGELVGERRVGVRSGSGPRRSGNVGFTGYSQAVRATFTGKAAVVAAIDASSARRL